MPQPTTHDELISAIAAARAEADAGRAEAAEEIFLDVLSRSRDSASRAEVQACSSLVTLYSREQRDFETLPFARRLIALATELDDHGLLCRGLAAVAGAFEDLDDLDRCERIIDSLQSTLSLFGALGLDTLKYRRIVHSYRTSIALTRGQTDPAVSELEALRESFAESEPTPAEQRWIAVLDARVYLALGLPKSARDAVTRGRAIDAPAAIGGLALDYFDVCCTIELEGPVTARISAKQMLARLRQAGPQIHGTTQRMRFFTLLGHKMRERCDAAEIARDCYDVAATAAIGRMFQLHRSVGRVPELEYLNDDDRRALTEYRQRFKSDQLALLRSVAQLLEVVARTQRSLPEELSLFSEGVFLLCAWCERVCTGGGEWIPIGHFVPQNPSVVARHAICPDCRGVFEANPQ